MENTRAPDAAPDRTPQLTTKRWTYVFLAGGSFWFGALALVLVALNLSATVLGWMYVEPGATGGHAAIAETFGARCPKVELAINSQTGTYFKDGSAVLLWLGWCCMALGFVLALLTCFVAPCKGRLLPLGFLANLLALLLPFAQLLWAKPGTY